jgi:small-conductance mechanosensitive channel/nucleotide-binding universal stress UspA family protein
VDWEVMDIGIINIILLQILIDLEQEMLNWNITLGQFILFSIILIIGIIVTIIVPSQIAKYISLFLFEIYHKAGRPFRKTEKMKEIEKLREVELKRQIRDTLAKPLTNLLRLIFFSLFALIALRGLGYDLDTPFKYQGYPFTLQHFITFFLVIIIFLIFIRNILSPLIRITLYVLVGRDVKRTDLNILHRSLQPPAEFLLYILMIYVALHLAFPVTSMLPYYEFYVYLIIFFAILIGTYFGTVITLTAFRIKFIIQHKMETHAAVAFENLVKVIAFLIFVGIILVFFNVELTGEVAIVIGFIGIAFGFGLQHTIANVMAGFALAADKPFAVGDRIRVGQVGRETWGDVIDIGLNSTKIRTVEEEIVVIPNNVIATNEVWNFTRDSPIIVLKLDIGISYGSDWRLAKKIMLEEARKHRYILRKPQPIVRFQSYSESSQQLQLWLWLRNARDKEQIRSDMLETIKDRFDAEGVEIPFPYRTIVYKKDLKLERRLPKEVTFDDVRKYPSKGSDYYEVANGELEGTPISKVVHEEDVRILTPVSGMHSARPLAEYSMTLARKIGGNVTALFIVTDDSGIKKQMGIGLKALSIFEKYGTKYNVNVATKIETGDVVDKILETIEKGQINLVVIGGTRKMLFGKIRSDSLAGEIIDRSNVPVVTMPPKYK